MNSKSNEKLESESSENTNSIYQKLFQVLNVSSINDLNEKYLIITLSFIFYCYIFLRMYTLSNNLAEINKLTADHRESIHLLLKTNLNHLYNNCVNLSENKSILLCT